MGVYENLYEKLMNILNDRFANDDEHEILDKLVIFQHWFLQNIDLWKIVEVRTRRKGRMFVDVETQRVCLS